MRVRTVIDLGADAIYLRNHKMLLVDADLSTAQLDRAVRMACVRYETHAERHMRLV